MRVAWVSVDKVFSASDVQGQGQSTCEYTLHFLCNSEVIYKPNCSQPKFI